MLIVVRLSPNTDTPTTIAVTGSNAPSIDTGTDPMQCIATVIAISDTTVGKIEIPNRLPQADMVGGNGFKSVSPFS